MTRIIIRTVATLSFAIAAAAAAATAQQAPDAAPRLSPTLYFADSAAERSSRAGLHARIEALARAIEAADYSSLVERLTEANEVLVALQRHDAYLRARTLENTQDRAAKDAYAALNDDESAVNAAMESRLQRVPRDQIAGLGRYAKLARDVQAGAAHRLLPDAERYRGSVVVAAEQSMSDAYDARIASIGDFKGVTSPDVGTRRAALARRDSAFDSAAPVIATLLGTLIDVENRDAAAHGFRNAADQKYAALGLRDTLVERTLAAVAAQASVYKDYETLIAEYAARHLGVARALSDERDVGLSTAAAVPFEQGRQIVLDALAPLGPDYVRRFARLLDPANGRLDMSGGAQRANTGTSIVAYDAPVALYVTTYTGSLGNLRVIAHEGGHAIHRELMNADSLPVYERTGPHDLFEGYAIFNQWLLLDHAAKVAGTAADRERALETLLASMAVEIFTSAEETGFERSLYAAATAHPSLDRARIDEIYRASIAPYEYWPMSDVGTSRRWMSKELLFEDPLYLVNYLYASFVAVALWDRSRVDPDFARKYEALLRRGFDADPNVLLESMGIRLGDPGVIARAGALFKEKTDELEALYAAVSPGRSSAPSRPSR
jgi:oligoendopeptidase F